MNFASILFNVMLIVQGGPCGSTGPQPPCCDNTPPCGGGPPPPPGLPIDALVYLLFFFALVYGVYMMNKINNRQLAV